MGSLSNFAELKLLDHVFNVAYTPVVTVYLALCTASPGEAGTGAACNEVANSNGYVRTAITFAAAASRAVAQTGVVTFPLATGAGWGTATDFAVVDTATYGAGNMLGYGALAAPKTIVAGNTPSIATGATTLTYNAGGLSTYLANKLLDLMFRNIAYAKPATYAALCTATVADADTAITEPAGGSYARKLVNINGGASPTWRLAAAGAVTNLNQIDFANPTASWGTVVAGAAMDALTVGNILFYDNGLTDQAIASGDTVYFVIDAWSNSMD